MSKKKTKDERFAEIQKINDLTRYQVRNSLFRIRDGRVENKELADFVWKIIQPQLKHPEGLRNFTFDWDVNPNKPSEVIRRKDWENMKADKYPDEFKMQTQVEEEITLFTAQE